MKDLFRRRAALMLWGPLAGFASCVLILGAEWTIAILNAALFALAAGVAVAFAPDAYDTIRGRRPLNSVFLLVLGVCVAWGGTLVGRGWNIVWRLLDQPLWLANSALNAFGLFLLCYGAICHLAADEALDGNRIPAKRWIKWGVIVASTVFFMVVVSYAVDRLTEAGIFAGVGIG